MNRFFYSFSLLPFFFGLISCVERRIDIQSTPSDAEVYLDGEYQGKTPISIPFDFYGTREVRLRKRIPLPLRSRFFENETEKPLDPETEVFAEQATEEEIFPQKIHYLGFSTFITLVPPIYETFPIDFITENLIPYVWKDVHHYNFSLKQGHSLPPQEIEALLKRNNDLRERLKSLPPTSKILKEEESSNSQ